MTYAGNIVTRGLGSPGGILVSSGLGIHPCSGVILTGDADLEHGGHEVSGEAAIHARASQYVGARPGGRHGVIPSTAFIVAEYQRQEIERQLARIVTGDASVDHGGADVSASGRVKFMRLVASASVDAVGHADCSAFGEFFDTELEMIALLLAA